LSLGHAWAEIKRKANAVAANEKSEDKVEEVKGKTKEKVGEATGNEQWQAEGKADQTKGKLKQAGKKAKEAFTDDE
jgi:uncharacterized protein YjbJ (UPF0337 family)